MSVKILKLTTRPPTTAYGRRRRRRSSVRSASCWSPEARSVSYRPGEGSLRAEPWSSPPPYAIAASVGAPTVTGTFDWLSATPVGLLDGVTFVEVPPRAPRRTPGERVDVPLTAPAAKITGMTGMMQGEMPVTKPPRKPIRMRMGNRQPPAVVVEVPLCIM